MKVESKHVLMLLHCMIKIEPSLVCVCVCTVNVAEVIKSTLVNVTLFQRKYIVYNISSICSAAVQTRTTELQSCSRSALLTCAMP